MSANHRQMMAGEKLARWTAEEDATLARLIDEGRSAGMAAKEMGRSRNSVMSRAFRRNLQFHGQHNRPPAKRAKPTRNRALFGQDEDKIILEMAADGKSGADIAEVIKRNKSSVVKRARLLGAKLNGRNGPKPSDKPKAVKLNSSNIAGKKASRANDPEFNHVTPVVAVDPLMVDLVDLRPSHCRFPVGDPREEGFAFCGLDKAEGAYCQHHARLCYTAPEMRRRAA